MLLFITGHVMIILSRLTCSKFQNKGQGGKWLRSPPPLHLGPGLQINEWETWPRGVLWPPREQAPHHPPPLLPGGKAACRGQIAQCLRRSQRSGWLCAMCQFLNVGSLLRLLFKLCWPPLCRPYEIDFQARSRSWIASFDLQHQVLFFSQLFSCQTI